MKTVCSYHPYQTLYEAAQDVLSNWELGDLAAAVRHLDAACKQSEAVIQERINHEGTIQCARSNYADPSDDDIEIDDDPLLSVAEDGVWVQAWVWVRTAEEEC